MLVLFLYFVLLSLLAVGGVNTIIPEMQRIVVETEGWMTGADFTSFSPFPRPHRVPNVLITSLVGFKVAGLPGAFVTLAGFCVRPARSPIGLAESGTASGTRRGASSSSARCFR
jgi:chromate transporter